MKWIIVGIIAICIGCFILFKLSTISAPSYTGGNTTPKIMTEEQYKATYTNTSVPYKVYIDNEIIRGLD